LNKITLDGIDIEIATIHSTKGQTHTATLYLETCFYKKHESQRLSLQFLLEPLKGTEGKQVKQSAKMVYVGFSRPTHLLCFAVHRDRFEEKLPNIDASDNDASVWKLIRLDEARSESP
jgi:DNA helicase-2/ATP-dependent DNA helicase PcrA